jgi:hypothetical protein
VLVELLPGFPADCLKAKPGGNGITAGDIFVFRSSEQGPAFADPRHHLDESGVPFVAPAMERDGKVTSRPLAIVAVLEGANPETDGLVRWRCADIQAYIAETYQVAFHVRWVGRLLHKLRLSHLSVRPLHPQGDAPEAG